MISKNTLIMASNFKITKQFETSLALSDPKIRSTSNWPSSSGNPGGELLGCILTNGPSSTCVSWAGRRRNSVGKNSTHDTKLFSLE